MKFIKLDADQYINLEHIEYIKKVDKGYGDTAEVYFCDGTHIPLDECEWETLSKEIEKCL